MQVRFYATLRPIVGGRLVDVAVAENATVRDLVDAAIDQFPRLRPELLDEHDQLWGHVHVMVNGRDAPYLPDGLQTRLRGDEAIDIFPPVAGGTG